MSSASLQAFSSLHIEAVARSPGETTEDEFELESDSSEEEATESDASALESRTKDFFGFWALRLDDVGWEFECCAECELGSARTSASGTELGKVETRGACVESFRSRYSAHVSQC